MEQLRSGFFTLNLQDVAKAVGLVIITALLGALQQAVTAHGFDIGAYDWGAILDIALSAGGSYLVKNLLSTSDGKLLGKIG